MTVCFFEDHETKLSPIKTKYAATDLRSHYKKHHLLRQLFISQNGGRKKIVTKGKQHVFCGKMLLL